MEPWSTLHCTRKFFTRCAYLNELRTAASLRLGGEQNQRQHDCVTHKSRPVGTLRFKLAEKIPTLQERRETLWKYLVDTKARRLDALRTRVYNTIRVAVAFAELGEIGHGDLSRWEETADKTQNAKDDKKRQEAQEDENDDEHDKLTMEVIEKQPKQLQKLLKTVFWAPPGQQSLFAMGRQERHRRSHHIVAIELIEFVAEEGLLSQEDKEFVRGVFEWVFGLSFDTPLDDPRQAHSSTRKK